MSAATSSRKSVPAGGPGDLARAVEHPVGRRSGRSSGRTAPARAAPRRARRRRPRRTAGRPGGSLRGWRGRSTTCPCPARRRSRPASGSAGGRRQLDRLAEPGASPTESRPARRGPTAGRRSPSAIEPGRGRCRGRGRRGDGSVRSRRRKPRSGSGPGRQARGESAPGRRRAGRREPGSPRPVTRWPARDSGGQPRPQPGGLAGPVAAAGWRRGGSPAPAGACGGGTQATPARPGRPGRPRRGPGRRCPARRVGRRARSLSTSSIPCPSDWSMEVSREWADGSGWTIRIWDCVIGSISQEGNPRDRSGIGSSSLSERGSGDLASGRATRDGPGTIRRRISIPGRPARPGIRGPVEWDIHRGRRNRQKRASLTKALTSRDLWPPSTEASGAGVGILVGIEQASPG